MEMHPVGAFQGITVFSELPQPSSYDVVYLPVSSGCEYRPYDKLGF